jgi:hypothetical protein
LSTEFKALIINDILGVLYAPHKAFKKIAENPKYLGVAIIIALFVAVQVGFYYTYYGKVNYEQTAPEVASLNQFAADNATQWVTGAAVSKNTVDFINQTYFGNNSLQFAVSNGNNLSATLKEFGYSVNCGDGGFPSLVMSIKQTSPTVAPQSAILTLYTSNGTTNYFQLDITSMLSSNLNEWNNLTIPVDSSQWQNSGSANWSDITGLKLDVTYPSTSNITIQLQGVFFRGQFHTQVATLGEAAFIGYAAYSIVIQALFQWIILAAMAFLILKGLKAANVTWRPLFVSIGFVLMVLIITSVVALIATTTLPTVSYPYDFPPYGSLIYPADFVANASPTSQATYQSIVAATTTYTTISTALSVIIYVWQTAMVTFAVKAVSGLSYTKSVLTAVGAVVLTVLALTLLAYIGLI